MNNGFGVDTPSDVEIRVRREFRAPRQRVFEALTKPELLRQWFGPHGHQLVVCEIDLRVGGRFRYVVRDPGGGEMELTGTYTEITPPDRIVHEENSECDAQAGADTFITTTLAEAAGRTTLTTTIRYPNQQIRDAVLHSGMEHGMGQGYEKLEALVGIAETYRRRADIFERKVAAVKPDQWDNPSPCPEWDARAVVGHIIDMHGVMFSPLGRSLSAGPSLADDPLGAFRSARADVEALLADPELLGMVYDTPGGRKTVAEHIDQVPSTDMVLHGWDLAKATGQDDTIDPAEVDAMLPGFADMPDIMRVPEAFGPGVVVFGPEFPVPADAPPQDRMIGLMGRNPRWTPPTP